MFKNKTVNRCPMCGEFKMGLHFQEIIVEGSEEFEQEFCEEKKENRYMLKFETALLCTDCIERIKSGE